jgi:hypothetical protein
LGHIRRFKQAPGYDRAAVKMVSPLYAQKHTNVEKFVK